MNALMARRAAEIYFDLEGRIAKQAEELQLRRFFQGHEIEDEDAEGADILMEGRALVYGKNSFFMKQFFGRQAVCNFNGHIAIFLCQ